MAGQHQGQGSTQSSPSQPSLRLFGSLVQNSASLEKLLRQSLCCSGHSSLWPHPHGLVCSLLGPHVPARSGNQLVSCFGKTASPCFTLSHLSLLPSRSFLGVVEEHTTPFICPSPSPVLSGSSLGSATQPNGSLMLDDQILFPSPLRLSGEVRGGCCLASPFSCLERLSVLLVSFNFALSPVEWKVCSAKSQKL